MHQRTYHRSVRTGRGKDSGITILESLIVIGLITMLTIPTVTWLRASRAQVALHDAEASIIRSFERARTNAVTGVGGAAYGAHVEDGEVAVFEGNVYIPGDGEELFLPLSIDIDPADVLVVFDRLTGEASGDVDVPLTLTNSVGNTTEITVTADGAVRIE